MQLSNCILLVIILLDLWNLCASLVPDVERQALLDLYEATNGPKWGTSSNWTIGDPCENEWKYVACNAAQTTVIKLTAYSNKLVGTLPDSLGNLLHLTQLDLGTNNINGTIPDSVWNLKHLKYLDFRVTNLTGTIPDTIGDAVNLTEIELYGSKFYGSIPSSITKLRNLQILSLDKNDLSGTIPDGFEQLTQLKTLYLNDNSLTGTIPVAIGKLPKLTVLQLQDNFFTGVIPFPDDNWPNINLNMSCNCFDSFPVWCFNSSCTPCLSGICNTTTAKLDISRHSMPLNLTLGVISGLCLILAIGSIVLLLANKDRFGTHGYFYSALINFGVIIGLLSALFPLPEPTDAFCVTFPWLFGIAFALVYGCLFIKTWALWKIWRLAKQFKRSDMTPRSIIYRVGICVAFEIVFLIIWTVVDPPKARIFTSVDGSLRRHCTSEKYGYSFWIASIVYKEAWMLFGLVLTLLTKSIQKDQSEPKEIALAIYNVFAVSVIGIPLAFALKNIPEALVVVQVGAVLLAFTFTLLAIFFNVWYKIFEPPDNLITPKLRTSNTTTSAVKLTTSTSTLENSE